jgi:hypothetical protein
MLQFHPEPDDSSKPYSRQIMGATNNPDLTGNWHIPRRNIVTLHSFAVRSQLFTVAKNMQEGNQMADKFLWIIVHITKFSQFVYPMATFSVKLSHLFLP